MGRTRDLSRRTRSASTAGASADAHLAALIRAATGHSIIATDLAGTITVFNSGAERLLGYRADEVVGRCTPEVFHDPLEMIRRADELGVEPGFEVFAHLAREGAIDTRDWTYLARDRTRLTVSLSVTGVRGEDGALAGFIGIATDVTAARAAERELTAQRELYQTLVDNLPFTSVGLLDDELRWTALAGHYPRSIARSGADFVGRPIGWPKESEDLHRLRELLGGARHAPVHAELATPDERAYEVDAIPLDRPHQRAVVLAVVRDVTERRRAERRHQRVSTALTLTEQSFRAAFDDAPGAVALVTLDEESSDSAGGAATGARFLRVNAAFAALLGHRPDELADTRVDDIVHPEDRHLPIAWTAAVRPARKRYLHASGRTVWVEVSCSEVVDETGAPQFYVKHVVDLTARMESDSALLDALEQQRLAAAHARQLARTRTDMITTVSHELRTPLTVIRGYLELIADGGAGRLNSYQQTMMDVALSNSERLGSFVNDLLTIVGLDETDLEGPSPVPVELGELCRSVVQEFAVLSAGKDQQVVLELAEQRATVRGDRDQLHRALLNLLSNAVTYTEPGGRITVRVAVTSDSVVVSVTDSGIGIPDAEQARLFQRVLHASTARTPAGTGTGLGLAIAKSIVDGHHGSIEVESVVGEGTTVRVSLPAAGPTGLGANHPADLRRRRSG